MKKKISETVMLGFFKSPGDCEKEKIHREHDMGYSEYFDYCERMEAKGKEQVQCKDCGLFIWPEFWGKK